MAGPITKTITRLLILFIAILGMAAPSRHAVASWWEREANPETILGITSWQPLLSGYLEFNDGKPDGFNGKIDRIQQGISQRCQKLLDLLTDEKAIRAFADGGDETQNGFHTCVTMMVLNQAKPAPLNTFDTGDLISDIENRLDLKSFRSSYAMAMSGVPGPIFFRDLVTVPKKDDFEDIIIKDHAKLQILSRWEDRDSWIRETTLLAAADWTGDGQADLLVLYYDQALNMGTYSSLSPMILTTDSRSGVITAVEAAYWILDHRVQLLEALGHLRK